MSILSNLSKRLFGKPAPTKLDPSGATYDEAIGWFEGSRAEYNKLVTAAGVYVDPAGVFFDVGANIGFFSLLLMEKIGFKGSAYLFEPIPNLAAHCRKTFEGSRFSVNVIECALSDADGEVEIFTAGDGNIGWNTLVAGKASADMKRIAVPARRFDSLDIALTPSFVKIDVEGAEYRVLRGMMESIRNWNPRPVILCEVGWGKSHPEWEKELQVFNELASLGYSFHKLEDKSKLDIASLEGTTDILCLPAEAK